MGFFGRPVFTTKGRKIFTGKTVTVQYQKIIKIETLINLGKISSTGGPPPPLSAHLGIQMSLLTKKSRVQGKK